VITGFNTDIEHGGVVYHVQTEDKGLDTPIILSLVYAGGAILASKRAPYEDLIAEGFSDEALAERLKRQHRLICAAIHSGRINDLKKMSGRATTDAEVESATLLEVESPTVTLDVQELELEPEEHEEESTSSYVDDALEIEYSPMTQEWVPPTPPPVAETTPEPEPEPVYAQPAAEYSTQNLRTSPRSEEVWTEGGVVITLLDDEEFYSGETRTLRVLVTSWSNGDHTPIVGATVSIKILGTAFRPLIYSLKTQKDGVATVATQIPQFNSGRAAVLIRAVAKEQAAELRRIIHPD
jgi:hypothetical protein